MDYHFLSEDTDDGGQKTELRGGVRGDGVDIEFYPSGDVAWTDTDGEVLIPQVALTGENLNHIQIIVSGEDYTLLVNDILVRSVSVDSKNEWRDGYFRFDVTEKIPVAFDNMKVWDLNALKPPNQ